MKDSTTPHLCEDCGVNLGECDVRTKVCPPCSKERHRLSCRDHSRRKRGSIPPDVLTCQKCGAEFPRTANIQRYCVDCSPYRNDRTQPSCIDCGVPVKGRGWRCPPCGRVRRTQRQRERDAQRPPRTITCAQCGETKIPESKTATKYCSRECADSAAYERRKALYWADPAGHAAEVKAWHQKRIASDPEYRERV